MLSPILAAEIVEGIFEGAPDVDPVRIPSAAARAVALFSGLLFDLEVDV